jgi:hypothetical protein
MIEMENTMRLLSALAAILTAAPLLAVVTSARAEESPRISGPFTHSNLSVYFVHGASASGPAPLTLQEALEKDAVEVIETGSVNELQIRNKGDEEIFIQSGDIVKGGRQDRVVTVSFVLPPKSGKVPLASFCVEHGRWSGRGKEDAARFSSSAELMPSREAKLAMKAPLPASDEPLAKSGPNPARRALSRGNDTGARQTNVWNEVAKTQSKLSGGVQESVNSSVSATSLQLSLENEKLQAARVEYIKALEPEGLKGDDVIGYVFAVNGRINSADLYPSNALFRKMWGKLLAASVTEAIGESGEGPVAQATPPEIAAVKEFLASAEKGKSESQDIASLARQEVRDNKESLYVAVQTSKGAWVHRNYLKK